MKNIFVLPTDKPSRLWLYKNFDNLLTGLTVEKSKDIHPQNIYITSDEEIKVGDWCIMINDFDDKYLVKVISLKCIGGKEIRVKLSINNQENTPLIEKCKKIILTTDQDLIKDGVQTIDDEFLEWFVNNPSCQYGGYKDINWDKIITLKEEPKQETLEEAAERMWNDPSKQLTSKNSFIEGAKSDAARDYWFEKFEEDLKTAYFSGIKTTGEGWNGEYANGNNPSIEEEFQEGFQEWLRHFKKK
jgi:hypothetical protein